MIVFSCSAMHAAVNFSQLDFALWIPNCPSSMSRPPPQEKGSLTEDDLLHFLPDVSTSCGVPVGADAALSARRRLHPPVPLQGGGVRRRAPPAGCVAI
ncbi:hypothetical protein KUCAC02_034140 [Chaenocephalus aceratus]|nr:hypothetical protein KUCAC02_034140 [Chaenocephalus aceratus]